MNLIRRIIGDILGCFELTFLTLFRSNHGMLSFLFAPILIPAAIVWRLIKLEWHILTMLFKQRRIIGKIFIIFIVLTDIITLVGSSCFPDVINALKSFEPISIAGFNTMTDRLSSYLFNLSHTVTEVTHGQSTVLPLVATVLAAPVIMFMFVMLFAAMQIPIVAYIWSILFIAALFGLVMEFIQNPYSSIVREVLGDFWNYDIKLGLMLTISGCFEFPLNLLSYGIPGINVIIYRLRQYSGIGNTIHSRFIV